MDSDTKKLTDTTKLLRECDAGNKDGDFFN